MLPQTHAAETQKQKPWLSLAATGAHDSTTRRKCNVRTYLWELCWGLERAWIVTGTILLLWTPACECFLYLVNEASKSNKTILVCKNDWFYCFLLKILWIHNRSDSQNHSLHFLSKISKVDFHLYFQYIFLKCIGFSWKLSCVGNRLYFYF